jgi:hypothetical protein
MTLQPISIALLASVRSASSSSQLSLNRNTSPSIRAIIANMAAAIAPDGDLVLLAGPEKVRIHVHSLVLKMASGPFSAMFSPQWKEGQDLAKRDGPLELELLHDNAEALIVICAVLHHKNELVAEPLAPALILEVAVIADKYDFIEALKFTSKGWFFPLFRSDIPGSDFNPSRKPEDTFLLAVASYVLQSADAFHDFTKELALYYEGSYLEIVGKRIESTCVWTITSQFCRSHRT